MIICYHGTKEENAKSIQLIGFKVLSYFSFNLADAIAFGGPYIFSVRFHRSFFNSDLNNRDWWQFRNNEIVQSTEIVCLRKYDVETLYHNKELGNVIFEHNLEKKTRRLKMTITAKDVKELRVKTGAPMMDCKAALTETSGNFEEAIDWLRKKGAQIADKKSSREASQGLVGVHIRQDDDGTLYGAAAVVNCETDFVAKNETFQQFVSDYVRRAAVSADVEESEVTDLIAKVGENIKLGSKIVLSGGSIMTAYVHNQVADNMGSIGVIVVLGGAPSEEAVAIGKDIAMHITASDPKAVDECDLDQEWLARERNIFVEQARDSGKPDNIIEKMVEGRMKKVMRENTLVNQPFVKDMDKTVGKLLEENDLSVLKFFRLSVAD